MFLAELSKENQKNYLEIAYALVNADGKVTEEELNNLDLYKAEIPGMSDINDYKTNSISEPLKELSLLGLLKEFENDKGECIHLTENNLCDIYENRPDVCDIEKMYKLYLKNTMTHDEYLNKNYKVCINLKKDK